MSGRPNAGIWCCFDELNLSFLVQLGMEILEPTGVDKLIVGKIAKPSWENGCHMESLRVWGWQQSSVPLEQESVQGGIDAIR